MISYESRNKRYVTKAHYNSKLYDVRLAPPTPVSSTPIPKIKPIAMLGLLSQFKPLIKQPRAKLIH